MIRSLSWGNDISYLGRFDVAMVKTSSVYHSFPPISVHPCKTSDKASYIYLQVVEIHNDRLGEINSMKLPKGSLMKATVN